MYDNSANGDEDDQIFNDQNTCVFNCSTNSSTFCYSSQALPSLGLVLGTLAILVFLDLIAMAILHLYCWKAMKMSVARFGYHNLHH